MNDPEAASSGVALDARQVRRRFERAARQAPAPGADGHALVAEINRRMLERLDYVKLDPGLIVDAGCGAGAALSGLAARFPGSPVVGVDFAVPVLQRATRAPGQRWPQWLRRIAGQPPAAPAPMLVAADFARLPLADAAADCVWSNLALHWHDDPPAVFAEWHRVLREGGLAQFSTLGPDTLQELRAASRSSGAERVHRFVDMHDVGDMLVHAGFADPVMDMETVTLTYRALDDLFADLRGAGATNARRARSRGLSGRRAFERLRGAYEAMRRDGLLPATFEIVYGHAWKPKPLPGRARDGVAVIRVGDIGGARRRV